MGILEKSKMISLETKNIKIMSVIKREKHLGCLIFSFLFTDQTPNPTTVTAIIKFGTILPGKCSIIKLYMSNRFKSFHPP